MANLVGCVWFWFWFVGSGFEKVWWGLSGWLAGVGLGVEVLLMEVEVWMRQADVPLPCKMSDDGDLDRARELQAATVDTYSLADSFEIARQGQSTR